MGRAERRKAERRDRIDRKKHGTVMTHQEIGEMKADIQSKTSKYDVEALMTCFAYAEHQLYGFGYKRIMRSLKYIDELMGYVLDGEYTIEDYKKFLEEETGVIVKAE